MVCVSLLLIYRGTAIIRLASPEGKPTWLFYSPEGFLKISCLLFFFFRGVVDLLLFTIHLGGGNSVNNVVFLHIFHCRF